MDTTATHHHTTVIVGAGISGLVLAMLLSKRGHHVTLFDKRSHFTNDSDGRSINFTISGRGLNVLEKLGLKQHIMSRAVTLFGRSVYPANGQPIHYQYGTHSSQTLLSIRRSDLIDILFEAIQHNKQIALHLGFELISIDCQNRIGSFVNKKTGVSIALDAECIIGADGVFSKVRDVLIKNHLTSYQQKIFDWGYCEFQFSRDVAQKLNLSIHRMHLWPKKNALLVAIPNIDESFSVICTAPLYNKNNKPQDFITLIQDEFNELITKAPECLAQNRQNALNYMLSIRIDAWHHEDFLVLIGDACHATYPFYGQGMNSALEDALILDHYLSDTSRSRLDALKAYERNRKTDTDALHQLSEDHLPCMTQSMISPFWQAADMLDYQIATYFPKAWFYEYAMVAHTNIPYATILKHVAQLNVKKRWCGFFILVYCLGCILYLKKHLTRYSQKKNRKVINTPTEIAA